MLMHPRSPLWLLVAILFAFTWPARAATSPSTRAHSVPAPPPLELPEASPSPVPLVLPPTATPGTVFPSPALPSPVQSPSASPSPTLTLEGAVSQAMQHNPTLYASEKAAEATFPTIGQAYAGYYPTIAVSITQSHTRFNPEATGTQNVIVNTGASTLTSGGRNGGVTTDQVIPTATLRQIIYDFDVRKLGVIGAEQSYLASLAQMEQTRQQIILTVRQDFFTAWLAQANLAIQQASLEDQLQHLQQAQGFYEVGTKAKVDVTNAQSLVATAQLAVLKAQNALDVAWVALNVAMGLPRDTRYALVVDARDNTLPVLSRDELLRRALAVRPELLNLRAQLRSDIANLEQTYRQSLPQLSGNASYERAGNLWPFTETWNVGLSLTFNVFNGWLSHYQADQQRKLAEQVAWQLVAERQTVYQDFETSWLNYHQGAAEIPSAQAGVSYNEENFRLVTERYRVGLGSTADYFDAQLQLAQARQNLATAYADFYNARASLEHAVGTLELEQLPPELPEVLPDRIPGVKKAPWETPAESGNWHDYIKVVQPKPATIPPVPPPTVPPPPAGPPGTEVPILTPNPAK
jgi:outer membrane protein TolC